MSETNNKNEGTKSKIEQIRIDLEKKLAALESSKLEKEGIDINDSVSDVINSNVVEKINNNNIDIEKKEIIIEESVVNETIVEEPISAKPSEPVLVEETHIAPPVFEISDTIETIKEEAFSDVIIEKSKIEIEDEISLNKTPIIDTKTEVVMDDNLTPSVSEYEDLNEDEDYDDIDEDENSSSKMKYILYGLLSLILLATGYFLFDSSNKSNSLENDKMNRIISQYKNKSYLDSIELADANNQLLDIQNQKIIDSVASDIQLELSNKINKNKNNSKTKPNSITKPSVVIKDEIITKSSELDNIPTNSLASNADKGSLIKAIDVPVDDNPENVNKVADSVSTKNEVVDVTSSESNNSSTTSNVSSDEEKVDVNEKVAVKPKVIKSPIYPGCEKKRTDFDRKKCSTSKIIRHIQRKFNADVAQDLGLKSGIYKVKVSFIIDKNGDATVLNVRTNDKRLENEAIRVVQSLPKMTPGREDGKRATKNFSVPIQFSVEN